MVLPLVKLGTLALKSLSKPIASRLKTYAAHHERFRSMIINIAQTNHRFSTNLQRRLYGHSTETAVRPLNEEKAVQAATDLIGEIFIFTVAGGAVIFEVQRSSRSEARKEEARKQELEKLRQRDEELEQGLALLTKRVGELEKHAKSRGFHGILNLRSVEGKEE